MGDNGKFTIVTSKRHPGNQGQNRNRGQNRNQGQNRKYQGNQNNKTWTNKNRDSSSQNPINRDLGPEWVPYDPQASFNDPEGSFNFMLEQKLNGCSSQQNETQRFQHITTPKTAPVTTQNTTTQNAATQNAATQNTATQNAATQNTTTQNTAIQNTTIQNTTAQNTATWMSRAECGAQESTVPPFIVPPFTDRSVNERTMDGRTEIPVQSWISNSNSDPIGQETGISTGPMVEQPRPIPGERLIILDINGILCWKVLIEEHPKEKIVEAMSSFGFGHIELPRYIVFIRPYVKEFLNFCYEYADVGFFSSTTQPNAWGILNHILTEDQKKKTKFYWYREHTKLDPNFRLDPSIFGHDTIKLMSDVFSSPYINCNRTYGYYNTVIVDDAYQKVRLNHPSNIQIVKSFDLDKDIVDRLYEKTKTTTTIDESIVGGLVYDETLLMAISEIRSKFIQLDGTRMIDLLGISEIDIHN